MRLRHETREMLRPIPVLGLAAFGAFALWLLWRAGGALEQYSAWPQPYRLVAGFYYALYRFLVYFPFLVPIQFFCTLKLTPFPVIDLIFCALLCIAWTAAFGFALLDFFVRSIYPSPITAALWRLFFAPLAFAIVFAIGSVILRVLFLRRI